MLTQTLHFNSPNIVLKFMVQATAPSWEQNKHLKTLATVGGFFFGFGLAELFLRPMIYKYTTL
jgi:hypothetical protein